MDELFDIASWIWQFVGKLLMGVIVLLIALLVVRSVLLHRMLSEAEYKAFLNGLAHYVAADTNSAPATPVQVPEGEPPI